MDFDAQENFQTMYNPFGVSNAAPSYVAENLLPIGMVPNQAKPTNPSVLQSGSPFTSEIEMQFGVIYAGVPLFPTNVTNALQATKSGYRLGLDVKDNNIPKFYIGGPRGFLLWDGLDLSLSGQISLYGIDDAINFFDQNGSPYGQIYSDSADGFVINGTLGLSIRVNNVDLMDFGTFGGGSIAVNVPFQLANLTADPSLLDSNPGMMYYNTTTGNIRAYVGLVPAWTTVV